MVTKISVLIPVFNGDKTIARAIDGILNQSHKATEIIVCNDGSTDFTDKICAGYGNSINYIRLPQNTGLANVRNYLIKCASYEYLAWQDADDFSHPERLKIQSEYLNQNKTIVAVGSYLNVYINNTFSHVRKYPLSFYDIKKTFLIYSPLSQPALMLRKSIFDTVGYYDNNFPPAEDYDMAERIIRIYEVGNINIPLIDYHLHGDNQTYKNYKSMVLNSRLVKKRFIDGLNINSFYRYILYIGIELAVFLALILPHKLFIYIFNKIRVLICYAK